jgi:hypothetical protein
MPPAARRESGTTSEATSSTPWLTGPGIVIPPLCAISMRGASKNDEVSGWNWFQNRLRVAADGAAPPAPQARPP